MPKAIILKLPDNLPRTIKKSKGVTCGLGICQFIECLLEINEANGISRNIRYVMNDETIRAKIIQEYPDRPIAEKLRKRQKHVSYWRTLYNLGLLTGKIPGCYSHQWNNSGQMICGRSGKPLTQRQIDTKLKREAAKLDALRAKKLPPVL